MSTQHLPIHVDVLIVGGGPVGALLAKRLTETKLSVLVAEARPQPADDPRALALSWGSRQILGDAGLWDACLQPTAIERVHISQQGTLGRVELNSDELGVPELGCVVAYSRLTRLVQERLAETPRLFVTGVQVTALHLMDGYAEATLQQEGYSHTLSARLVVLADGGQLATGLPGLDLHSKFYRQHALLTMLTPESPHHHTAWERFADDGPLALLPCGEQLALVWAQSPDQANSRLALDDAQFLLELNTRLGHRIPKMIATGPRTSFPLTLKTMKNAVGKRLVMIGNAAQTLHPIAGQGLNLGLRDAETLATLLMTGRREDVGTAEQLTRYARLRHHDAGALICFTDGLVELFRPNFAPLKHMRSLGLLALDLIGPVRRELAKKMIFGMR